MSLFWGFLFQFDFRIGRFDLLPDIIGYILFYNGFSRLEQADVRFGTARKLSIALIVLSIFDLVPLQSPGLMAAVSFGLAVLNLVVVYLLCQGVRELADRQGAAELSGRARSRWILYLIVSLIGSFPYVLLAAGPLVFVYLAFSLLALILMMALMRTCETELGGTQG